MRARAVKGGAVNSPGSVRFRDEGFHPRAITLGLRGHRLRAVAALIAQDRPAGVAVGEPVCLGEVADAVTQVGLRIEEAGRRALVAERVRGARIDLHEPEMGPLRAPAL